MKKLTFILSISLTLSAFGQVPNYVPTDGLVGWWPFNGNANDESGNGNNGIVNGAALTADRFGGMNQAYNFNGISNYIDVGNPSLLGNNPASYTQAGWVFFFDFSDAFVFMSKRHDNSGNDWATPVAGTNGKFIFFADDAFYENAPMAQSNVLIVNQWYHVVFVKSLDNYSIYVDGVLIDNITDSHVMGGSNNNLIIGAQLAWPEYMKGKLDDIGVWNRALTQEEIIALYNGCQQSISVQPQSQTASFNANAQFTSASSDPNATYQWQTNLGLGFQNLTDAGQYSGSGTNTLSISNVTLSNNNQQFRCFINSGSCSDTSSVAILTVVDNVGIEEQNQLQLFVYPNPASSTLTIENPQGLISNFVVMDATGREVLSGKLEGETILNLSSFSPGAYTILFENKALQELRVIKE
jgi:hypothetical protein